MVDIQEINEQIRFYLDRLSINNAYHDFEHLCRHLTRARICTNILPATGPVSGGGDQGRDFEIFRTYLNSSPIANSTFIGLTSEKIIAFACSLQKKNIETKIKHDVNVIMSKGSTVDEIIYFCTSDVKVSKRHELIEWAKDEYSIELEIHDGNSISELLSDREVFWIASKYLSIPSEIYPRIEKEENWYSKTFKKWKNPENFLFNYADFYEISAAARYATFDDPTAKQDIPFWIKLLEKFQEEGFSKDLKRNSIYEISVMSFRSMGTLIGRENLIREYFKVLPELEKFNELDDAVCLLNYCIWASHAGLSELTFEELKKWHAQILEKIEQKIGTVREVGLKCQLLELRGFIMFYPSGNTFTADLEGTMNSWMELVEIVKDALFFPLDRFSDRLTQLSHIIGDDPNYEDLTQKVDILLSERYGGFKAAEKCKDRALKFHDEEAVLKAINQFHQAKIKWFADGTLHESIISMIFISKGYLELGLSFAAKYYALAAAYIANHASDERFKAYMPRALLQAANCDYVQGSWCGFLELLDMAFTAHLNYSKDPLDLQKHEKLGETLYHASILDFTTKNFFDADLNLFTENMLTKYPPIKDLVESDLEIIEKTFKKDINDLWTKFEEQILGRPFGDCGNKRKVKWSEIGVLWEVMWQNDYKNTLVSEQLIATLQIILADLANTDLCLLKTTVHISTITTDEIKEPEIRSIPSNDRSEWEIKFPLYEPSDNMENLNEYFILMVNKILYEISVLPKDEFFKILEKCFENGISMKVFIARPYIELLRYFVDKELFDESDRSSKSIPESHRSFKVYSHEELRGFEGLGPGYNKEEAEEHIKSRYERSITPIKYTVERLRKDGEFNSIIKRLSEDGWLDWHILLALNNIAINYRIEKNMQEHPLPDFVDKNVWYQNEWEMIIDEEERKDSTVIPISEFSEEKLRFSLRNSMIATLKIWGLELRQMTPDFEAIDQFLGNRYNYWVDDVEHEKIF